MEYDVTGLPVKYLQVLCEQITADTGVQDFIVSRVGNSVFLTDDSVDELSLEWM